MIAIGGHFGGQELKESAIDRALLTAMRVVKLERSPAYDNGEIPYVNPVFVVPGSLSTPDFDDIQLGKFSRKDKSLVVEVSVPESVAAGQGIRDFIIEGLHMANAAAFHFFDDKGMKFPLREAEELVKKVGEELAEYA
jgi:hypothetical protein